MTIEQMKAYIKSYSSDQFSKKVDKMADSQVIAIYYRYKDKHEKHIQEVRHGSAERRG